jgi:hypothetical protein
MTSQITGHQFCALVQCLKLDPSPKTDVVHDIPYHTGRGFCAVVWCLKRYPSPKMDVLHDDIPNHIGCQFCALIWCLKSDPTPKADVLNDVQNQIGHPYCPNHIGCQLCTFFWCLKRDSSPKLMSYMTSQITWYISFVPLSNVSNRSISQNWHLIWCLKSCHTSFFSFSPPSCALLPCLKRYTHHKTDVQYDVPNHMEHQFCALLWCFKREPSP